MVASEFKNETMTETVGGLPSPVLKEFNRMSC
jgi:hypothetical protein